MFRLILIIIILLLLSHCTTTGCFLDAEGRDTSFDTFHWSVTPLHHTVLWNVGLKVFLLNNTEFMINSAWSVHILTSPRLQCALYLCNSVASLLATKKNIYTGSKILVISIPTFRHYRGRLAHAVRAVCCWPAGLGSIPTQVIYLTFGFM